MDVVYQIHKPKSPHSLCNRCLLLKPSNEFNFFPRWVTKDINRTCKVCLTNEEFKHWITEQLKIMDQKSKDKK